MMIPKKYILFSLLVVASLSLVACGAAATPEAPAAATEAAAPTEALASAVEPEQTEAAPPTEAPAAEPEQTEAAPPTDAPATTEAESSTTGGEPEKVVVFALASDVGGLDPNVVPASGPHLMFAHVYENLVQKDFGYETTECCDIQTLPILPRLATSWEWQDNKLVMQLREGVTFHDGTPLNAEAVEFNFRRWWDQDFEYYYAPSAGATSFITPFLEDVTATGEYEVMFTFPGDRNNNFLDFMSVETWWGLVSPTAIKEHGNEAIANLVPSVGTGPYIITEYEPGVRVVLDRNEDYWGTRPTLDRIIFVPIPDDSDRVAALLAGEVDIVAEVPPDLAQTVRDAEGVELYTKGKANTFVFQPNMLEPPTNDVRVRRALSLAIDREAIARDLYQDTALPAAQHLGIGNPGHIVGLEPDPYDPEEAKRLLAEAGYPEGFQIKTMVAPAGMGIPATQQTVEAVISYWNDIGVTTDLEVIEWITYVGKWIQGIPKEEGWGGYTMSTGLDSLYVQAWYCSTGGQPPNGVNVNWYSNPEADELFAEAAKTESEEEYLELYMQAAEIVNKDYCTIPIVHGLDAYGVSDRIINWEPNRAWAQLLIKADVQP